MLHPILSDLGHSSRQIDLLKGSSNSDNSRKAAFIQEGYLHELTPICAKNETPQQKNAMVWVSCAALAPYATSRNQRHRLYVNFAAEQIAMPEGYNVNRSAL